MGAGRASRVVAQRRLDPPLEADPPAAAEDAPAVEPVGAPTRPPIARIPSSDLLRARQRRWLREREGLPPDPADEPPRGEATTRSG